jgi:hypothetical protein
MMRLWGRSVQDFERAVRLHEEATAKRRRLVQRMDEVSLRGRRF